MGGDRWKKKQEEKGRLPHFVPLFKGTMDTPAWRAISHGAKVLYIALKRHLSNDGYNNGKLYVSYRKAKIELGSGSTQIARWYRELEHYGFIVQMTAGCLGVNGKGAAPHWRLTEISYMREPASRDFLKWDGQKYQDQKTESRTRKQVRGGPENRCIPLNPKSGAPPVPSGPENGCIDAAHGGPENGCISSLTTPSPTGRTIAISPELTALVRRRVGVR
jgi:hypothetical protein